MKKGSICWRRISNKTNCFVFDEGYLPGDEKMTWSGNCRGGVVHGKGLLRFSNKNSFIEEKGKMVKGKMHGIWSYQHSKGDSGQGPYVNGVMNGQWKHRSTNGVFTETNVKDGKLHGSWIKRFKNGSRIETKYKNGSRDGQPGSFINAKGKRYRGTWTKGCLIGRDGLLILKDNKLTWKDCRRISRRRR